MDSPSGLLWDFGSLFRTLRRHFLTRCCGSRLPRPRRCGDFGLVSRHKPAEHRFLIFPLFPTLRRRVSHAEERLRHQRLSHAGVRLRYQRLSDHQSTPAYAGLCSKLVFRNSGHIQQFLVEAISLRAGRVSLCGLDSLLFHLLSYLFAYQGIPDPASCRACLQRGGSVPEPTSPCTPLPQGSRLGDFAQPGKSAMLVVPRVADREDVRRSGPWVAHRDSGAALYVLSRQSL